MNLATDLAERARRNGWEARPAFLTSSRAWKHGEVHDLAARAATVLAACGVRPGDRVLLALPDSIGWIVAFLGAARLGATAVLVNPELPADDHAWLAADSRAALCVTRADLEQHFDRRKWMDIDWLLVAAAAAIRTGAHRSKPDTPLYIQYTSGTTGTPKGVVHCHRDPGLYHDTVGERVLDVGPTDVTLSVSRLYFAYGFGNTFAFPLYSGSAAVLTPDRPTPDRVRELAAKHKVTLLYAVPSAYAALVDDAGDGDFSSVRAAVSAGEALPAAVGDRAAALIGAPILEQIGSTEAGHAFCANSVAQNVPGTIGRPVPGYQLALRDAGGDQVPDGAEGELWVRGPTLLREYLNRPQDTAAVLVDGWLNTRDRACRLAGGAYRHTGRMDDMEMVGGITVSPLEVERVLVEHPVVREVAVAAVADQRGATKLRAYVVTSGAAVNPVALEAELIALAKRRLAAFKVPRSVQTVPALPRTPSGKLRRYEIRNGTW
ncbi:benzoate-CoA ligase family protein [Phytohabitans rumicis]|uniref:benzoate-CoA ligase family protein n=2 Tax=Phytohabitans rumicis TaxID=1076125 RepID=UPI0031EBCF55